MITTPRHWIDGKPVCAYCFDFNILDAKKEYEPKINDLQSQLTLHQRALAMSAHCAYNTSKCPDNTDIPDCSLNEEEKKSCVGCPAYFLTQAQREIDKEAEKDE